MNAPSTSTAALPESLRTHLHELEQNLRKAGLWDATPPSAEAMASSMPFMYDTLQIEQWLQWVFMPRLHALLDAASALPNSCSVHPLAEHEWTQRLPQTTTAYQPALDVLQRIDTLLTTSPSTPI